MLDRRMALRLLLGGLAAAGTRPALSAPDDDVGVFWNIEGPSETVGGTAGGVHGILFGYQRIAAAALPEMVNDGVRFLKTVDHAVIDHPNLSKPVKLPDQLPPLLPTLRPELAQQVRAILLAAGLPADKIDTLPSMVVLMVLLGEGAPPAEVTVGGVLFEEAKALGKPVGTLMTEQETQHFLDQMGPDPAAVEAPLTNDTVSFLLQTRREVGPIGAHCVALYRDRKTGELHRFADDLGRQSIAPLLWRDPEAAGRFYIDTLAPRIVPALATGSAFFFINGGTLPSANGVLDRLRKQGARVTSLA